MKLDKLLSIQSVIEGRKVPIDILENGYTHYSKNRDEYIELLDLDLIHFIRIFLKFVEEYNKLDVEKFVGIQATLNELLKGIQELKLKNEIEDIQYTVNQMYQDMHDKDDNLNELLSDTEKKKLKK